MLTGSQKCMLMLDLKIEGGGGVKMDEGVDWFRHPATNMTTGWRHMHSAAFAIFSGTCCE